jgi:hypothetical protein
MTKEQRPAMLKNAVMGSDGFWRGPDGSIIGYSTIPAIVIEPPKDDLDGNGPVTTAEIERLRYGQ